MPFTIENYAYRDPLGRETVTWVRTFETTKRRRFDAYMIWSEQRGRIVDYLGTHQLLAVDLDVSVAENGGLRLRSGEQRFYEGLVGFRFSEDQDWVRERKSSNGLTKDRLAFRWSFDTGETESVPSVGGYPSCFRGVIGQQERVAAMQRAQNAVFRFHCIDQRPSQSRTSPSRNEAMGTGGVDVWPQTQLIVNG